MQFQAQTIEGVWLIVPDVRADDRGDFARTFCVDAFSAYGLAPRFVQCNISRNKRRGTLRGLHWQDEPHGEGKLVRCTQGAIFDVALDIRKDSPTRGQWAGATLSRDNMHAFYIPPGFAHGFQTLSDAADVFYHMTARYHAESARGLRWNDPVLNIAWPLPDPVISERDAGLPLWQDCV